MKICLRGYEQPDSCYHRDCYHYFKHEDKDGVDGHFCRKDLCGAIKAEVECVKVEEAKNG
mgnify:CR=1 FL=1